MQHASWLEHRDRLALLALLGACACSAPQAGSGSLEMGTGAGSGAQAGAAAGRGGMASAGTGGTSAASAGTSASSGTGGQSSAGADAPPSAGSSGAPAVGGSGGDSGAGSGSGAGGSPEPPVARFPPVTDLTAAGPYTPVTLENSGPGGGYTVYHPEELGPGGLEHPCVTWGNGATTVPGLYVLLPHLASHGFVVVASNNPFVTGEELRSGIDWLFEQNEAASSPFFQKLDTANVASMGYSLGSLGTFEIAADPRLVTTVHISGGAMDKAVVPNLAHPAAFFCGDPSDIAHANCESDFTLATVPVFYGVFPGDHLGILAAFAEPINEVVTGWLRWRLMHDDSLEPMFVGPDCSLCMDPGWTVKQKDFAVAP